MFTHVLTQGYGSCTGVAVVLTFLPLVVTVGAMAVGLSLPGEGALLTRLTLTPIAC